MATARNLAVNTEQAELRLPPGPEMNLLTSVMRQRRRVDPIAHFSRLAARFGDISHYRLGRRDVVFINHPDFLREVFVVQASNFIKERTQQRAKLLLGEGMITADGSLHKQQRQAAAPAFYRQSMAEHAAEIVCRAAELGEQWALGSSRVPHLPRRDSRGSKVGDRSVNTELRDIHREMMELALGILGATLLRTDLGEQVSSLNDAMAEIMDVYNAVVLLPGIRLLLRIPFTPLRKFVHARAKLHLAVDKLILEHRKRLPDAGGGDLLSLLLHAQAEHGWGDQHVRDQVVTMMLAGFETVAIGLTWSWYLLSQNPDAEARLHQELDAVLRGRLPSYDDLPRLRYSEMVLAEALRLYPPAWAMGRQAIHAFDLGDYHLPAGTTVLASQYILHRDPRFFPDPLRFDPERHSPEARARRPRGAYCPFGMGPRQCIGEAFAWMEGILILATLAQRYRMRHDERHEVIPEPLFTLRPRGGMPMRVEAR